MNLAGINTLAVRHYQLPCSKSLVSPRMLKIKKNTRKSNFCNGK